MPEVQSRTYANPRRLPRRNHYQEGPGFLFVATPFTDRGFASMPVLANIADLLDAILAA